MISAVERVTYGFQIEVADLPNQSEPITLDQVKANANIGFTAHDNRISSLITSCRKAYEDLYNVSLIGHSVGVSWQTFFDDYPLPYRNVGAVTATSLDGDAISDVIIRTVGGNSFLVGDYPDGIKLSYNTTAITDENINEQLIQIVTLCLMEGYTIKKALINVTSN